MSKTVDEFEREERDVHRTVRPAPKKRGPRMDRRRNRIETHDPDLEGSDADTSMNYKTIGGALREVERGVAALSNKLSSLLGKPSMQNTDVSKNMFEGLGHVAARKLAVEMRRGLACTEDALGCDSCYQDEIILLTDQIDGDLKKYLVIPPEQDYWALEGDGVSQLWFDESAPEETQQSAAECHHPEFDKLWGLAEDCEGCDCADPYVECEEEDDEDSWFDDEPRVSSRKAAIDTEAILDNTVTVSFDPEAQVYWVHVRVEESPRVAGMSFKTFDEAEAHANKESKRFGLPVVVNR